MKNNLLDDESQIVTQPETPAKPAVKTINDEQLLGSFKGRIAALVDGWELVLIDELPPIVDLSQEL